MNKERQKILNDIMLELSSRDPGIYYMATTDIAGLIVDYIQGPNKLPKKKLDQVKDLTREEVQYLFSFDEERTDS